MSDYYILDDAGNPKQSTLREWSEWYERCQENRRVRRDQIGSVTVSTVFLGIDHNWIMSGPPILFETMIFEGEHDGYQKRYATREEAIVGHEVAVQLVRS